ncbi:hypothetical protein P9477_23625, partial [Enterobacter mori]|uniref:hypothetical protein n=1 Tax=Enterobacter mori TaxID=539813 RepID=UPI00398A8C33
IKHFATQPVIENLINCDFITYENKKETISDFYDIQKQIALAYLDSKYNVETQGIIIDNKAINAIPRDMQALAKHHANVHNKALKEAVSTFSPTFKNVIKCANAKDEVDIKIKTPNINVQSNDPDIIKFAEQMESVYKASTGLAN